MLKLKKLFALLCCLIYVLCDFRDVLKIKAIDYAATVKAIADVCEKFFVEKSIQFEIIVYKDMIGQFGDIIDVLLRMNNG